MSLKLFFFLTKTSFCATAMYIVFLGRSDVFLIPSNCLSPISWTECAVVRSGSYRLVRPNFVGEEERQFFATRNEIEKAAHRDEEIRIPRGHQKWTSCFSLPAVSLSFTRDNKIRLQQIKMRFTWSTSRPIFSLSLSASLHSWVREKGRKYQRNRENFEREKWRELRELLSPPGILITRPWGVR